MRDSEEYPGRDYDAPAYLLLTELRDAARFIIEVLGYLPDQYAFSDEDIVFADQLGTDQPILSRVALEGFIQSWFDDEDQLTVLLDEDCSDECDDFLAATMWAWNPEGLGEYDQ